MGVRASGYLKGSGEGLAPSEDESTYLPTTRPMLVKNGSLSLEVAAFAEAEKRVREIATAHGGFVSASSLNKDADGRIRGTLSLRVPADRFEAAVEELSTIGKLRHKEVTGTDVTEEYVDLEARLRNLQNERERLRTLFDRSGKVSEILEVEKELARVQGEIEQITARIRLLQNQVSLSTITAEIYEPGTASLETAIEWRYGRTVKEIARALLITLRKLVTFATAIAVFSVLWIPALLLLRFLVRKAAGQKTS